LGGANDQAYLQGTTLDDVFTATAGRAQMSGTIPAMGVPYLNIAADGMGGQRWDKVYAQVIIAGATGGTDTAHLYDSAGNDTFWGKLADAVLSHGILSVTNGNLITPNMYYIKASGFDLVNLFGSTGKNKKHTIDPLDYVLATSGPWIDA